MRRFILGVAVGLVTLCVFSTTASASATLVSHVYGCYRAIIQDGHGGIDAVELAYEGIDRLIDARFRPLELWRQLEQCQDLYDGLAEGPVVERAAFLERLAEVNRADPSSGNDRERQLYVLMIGLRDDLARCNSIDGAALYALLFGLVGKLGAGVCNNLDGRYYIRGAAGFGPVIGAAAAAALLPNNRLFVNAPTTGRLGAITRAAAERIIDAVLGRQGNSEGWPDPDFVTADIYVVSALGVGPALPLSSVLPDSAAACIEAIASVPNGGTGPAPGDDPLSGLLKCLRAVPGVAIGAGTGVAVLVEMPVHIQIPLLRLPTTLSGIVYGGVGPSETSTVETAAEALAYGL